MKKVNKKSSSKNKKTIKKNNVNKHKIGLVMLLLVVALFTIGISYAFFVYDVIGNGTEVVTGQIYMRYSDNNTLLLNNIFPESKEKALKRTDNIIKFTINGKNTSNKDIYYGISLNYGDEILNKTRIKPEHIMIYLESEGQVLIDGIRYSDWDNERIWVEKILANTNSQTSKEYSLHIWVDEEVRISDSNPNADYKTDEWNNSYISLKLSVDGKLETMNMPLSIETNDTFVENNKSYFIAKVSNFYDMSDLGKTLGTNDNMKLEISSTNSDIVFSYKDSDGNEIEETKETLDLTYLFNKNKTVEVQVFVSSKIDASSVSDLNFKLTRNNEVVQNFYKRVTVKGNNFCLSNGFNKLYDCILASDSLANDVETAKVNIANKGEVNLNTTAPTYTYVEDITYDVGNAYSASGYKFIFANNYRLNSETGTFELYNSDGSDVITDFLSDKYKDYYTCGATSAGYTSCGTIFKIKTTITNGDKYTISLGDKITYKVASSIRSEVGIYKTTDDYGDSYFYRGDVTNNNILLGGYYWKIIRANGDGTTRIIYNGVNKNAIGYEAAINKEKYSYSAMYPLENSLIGARQADPTYVGYMYGKNFEIHTDKEGTYNNFKALTKYYFADGYEFDETKEAFSLTKNKLEPVFKTLSEMNEIDEETQKELYKMYPYTCVTTDLSNSCEIVFQINSIESETKIKAYYISYSSTSLDGTRTNELSSNLKTQIEKWYENNIVGKLDNNGNLISEYIVDGVFCNDRGITGSVNNSGYLLNESTRYASNVRLNSSNVEATLKCNNDKRDCFSNTLSRGNGLLKYPIATITADEVIFAGGNVSNKNENYYLNARLNYWTMTPFQYSSYQAYSIVPHLDNRGVLYSWDYVSHEVGIRPVINIRSDVLIASGDGTMGNPFQLKLT